LLPWELPLPCKVLARAFEPAEAFVRGGRYPALQPGEPASFPAGAGPSWQLEPPSWLREIQFLIFSLFTFWAFILIKIYFSPETLTEKQISLYLGIKITG